jgi:recombination protein RecA
MFGSRIMAEKKDKNKDTLSDNKDLKTALAAIEKEFGKGSIMSLGDMGGLDIECISTGSLSLDLALGVK